MPAIAFDNVSKVYRNGNVAVHALRDVSFTVEEGEFICMAGPSGSGKSTLLHIAGILDVPTDGEVFLNDQPTRFLNRTDAALFRRKNIGFVFQRFNLIPVLSAFENVEYILSLLNVPAAERRARVTETLADVGLQEYMHHPAGTLSGGQQQRVAVARAIVARPRIILADEPTASLDSTTGAALIDLFAKVNCRQKTTCIFSSHDHRIINRAGRVLHLVDGRISQE